MKKLNLIGISIPSIFIIFIIIVGILNIGIKTQINSPDSILKQNIFQENQSKEFIGETIRTIAISNKFIIQRNQDINFAICTKPNLNEYSQRLDYVIYVNDKPYGNKYDSSQSIEINPGETKIIEIKPRTYNYEAEIRTKEPLNPSTPQTNSLYENISEIIIFTIEGNKYYDCQELITEEYNKGISIKLIE